MMNAKVTSDESAAPLPTEREALIRRSLRCTTATVQDGLIAPAEWAAVAIIRRLNRLTWLKEVRVETSLRLPHLLGTDQVHAVAFGGDDIRAYSASRLDSVA